MGLLDDFSGFMNTPGGMGLLSAVASGLAGARRGQPMNSIGAGLLGGLQGFAQGQGLQQQQQFNQQRQKLFDSQVAENEAQVKARQLALERQQTRDTFLGNAFAPQPIMQPSKDQAAMNAGNPYANPDFLLNTAKANNLPGLDQVPMGVKPVNRFDAIRANFSPEEALNLEALSAPKKPNVQTFKPGDTVRNMDTGEVVFQAPDKPAEAPSAVREYQFATGQGFKGSFQDWVMSQKRAGATNVAVNTSDPTAVAKAALSFQKDYRDATKPSFTRAAAYNAMMQASQDPTAKGDLTMVYSFIKALDPESVVREGEIDLVNANRSIPDRVKGYAQRLATGKSLLPQERQDLIEQARNLSFTDYNRSRNEVKAFRDNAGRLGLDPQLYAPDPYQGVDFGPRRLGGGARQQPPQAEAKPAGSDVQSLVDKYRSR